jgi:hypothetical protein
MLPITTAIGESLNRANSLIDSPRFGDPSWEALLQDEVDIWSAAYNEIVAITPPESLTDVHDAVVLAFSYRAEAGEELMLAIRTLDPDGFDRSAELMGKSTEQMNIASDLLNDFQEERGISPSTAPELF